MDSNKKLSDVNKKAVWEAIDVGTAVILASGRPMFGVLPVARMLELEKRGGYVLALLQNASFITYSSSALSDITLSL